MTEMWVTVRVGIFNIPTPYEVSNMGRIRRTEKVTNTFSGRILKPYICPTRNGAYLKVDLRMRGLRYVRFVHRLVAIAFVPNLFAKPEVNHFDENTLNNRADNLEWATRHDQEAHKMFMKATS